MKNFWIFITIVLAVLVFGIPMLLILSLKSDVENLKTEIKAINGVMASQLSWNKTSTEHDIMMDRRIDILEQKMRKVYGGWDSKNVPKAKAKKQDLVLIEL